MLQNGECPTGQWHMIRETAKMKTVEIKGKC